MYAHASQLINLPIVSLQTGEPIAWVRHPVISLDNLETVAFYCVAPPQKTPLLLLGADIRQIASDCLVVDNEEALTDPSDIVRLEMMTKSSFSPLGKTVVSDIGRKLGTVEDYTINMETNRIQQLHVRQSWLRSFFGANLLIDRTQIIDINPKNIVVHDATVKAKSLPAKETMSTQA